MSTGKKKLSCEMGANQEEHVVDGAKQILFRPFLRFINGDVADHTAFRADFDCNALFVTDQDAYNYLREILGVMTTQKMSTYSDNFAMEKANGKAQDFRS